MRLANGQMTPRLKASRRKEIPESLAWVSHKNLNILSFTWYSLNFLAIERLPHLPCNILQTDIQRFRPWL